MALQTGIYRIPGHCEPVTDVTGVAISWIKALPLDNRQLDSVKCCKRTERMTIGYLEFDGDSHTRKADWFLNDSVLRCPVFPLQIPIFRTTERYRAGGAARSESKSK